MKKVLIGLAAGALAFTATASSVNAGAADGKSVYDILTNDADTAPNITSAYAALLIDSAGLDEALDNCGPVGNNNGLPNYTVFFPASDAIFAGVLAAFDLTLGQLLAQPSLVKTVLLYHVVPSNIAPVQFGDDQNSSFSTMGGLTLIKTKAFSGGTPPTTIDFLINGYPVLGISKAIATGVVTSTGVLQACNGWVYLIAGFLAPSSAVGTIGLTSDGSTTQSAVDTSGDGLPKTGSESLALTYAALASLIAGAGVLVIRRRSVA